MRELEAHLRAQPDDRAAWTVYGDWLLEHGDVRGELVRSGREPTETERERWRGPVPEPAISAWRHGFVIGLAVPLDARSPRLVSTALADPAGVLISSLAIRRWSYRAGDVFEKPADDEAAVVVDSMAELLALDLRQLRAFAIQYEELTDSDIDALFAARLAITELDLRYTKLTDERFARLAGAPWFGGVRRLHLQRNPLTQLPALSLEHLDIRDTEIDPHGLSVPSLIAYGSARTLAGERVSTPPPAKLVEGLAVSARPTDRFTAPRYIDARSFSRTFTKDCARIAELPGFVVVYVDPDEWTFRTYENILPLDRLVEQTEVTLTGHAELAHEVHRFELRGTLPAFDELPLYAPPLDPGSRGGARYIFHAAPLAEALTRAIKAALPDLRGFSHVNPVFRCNRFEPGDEPFHRHFDTPYHDAARNQISQYTLLIYLTGGTGSPALQIEDLAIESIDPMQCFVFHQAYEHAGAAYTAGRKVFLRTELVFEVANVAQDPRIAALFSKACYLTGESIRDAELARDAARAYNAVAAAHWSGVLPPTSEPFIHKRFRGIEWLANGYDFRFPKALPLADCAAITLLDYFNCKLGDQPFRALVEARIVRDIDPEAFVSALSFRSLPALAKERLFFDSEHALECCPGHCRSSYDPTLSDDVIELHEKAQRFARERIGPAPITLLGEQVFLDPSRFVVDGNHLHVLSARRLAPVNFAACWNCHSAPPNFVDVDVTASVVQPLVPPIVWESTAATHHLMFDFFRNGWLVDVQQHDIPVPRIRTVDPEMVDEAETPWLEAAGRADVRLDLPDVRGPFWAHRVPSAVIRELFPEKR
jgi:uncharacterized protein (TIGR02996 family)